MALVILLLFFAFLPSRAEALPEQVCVRLFEASEPQDRIIVKGPFEIEARRTYKFADGNFEIFAFGARLFVRKPDGAKLPLQKMSAVIRGYQARPVRLGVFPGKLRTYKGRVVLSVQRLGDRFVIRARNEVPIFNYVCSVVGSESAHGFPAESLKAQAVLVLTRIGARPPNFVTGDSTSDMAYFGAEYENDMISDAVRAVWGVIMLSDGRPARSYFHSCCAGATSSGADIFGPSLASAKYLRSVDCNYCKPAPLFKETVRRIPFSVWKRVIADDTPNVKERDCAGRPISVDVSVNGTKKKMSGYDFWMLLGRRLGWDKAPGMRYFIASEDSGEDSTGISSTGISSTGIRSTGISSTGISATVIRSTGGGHGVGMCQWGAAGQARLGKSYAEILRYYFPGTTLSLP